METNAVFYLSDIKRLFFEKKYYLIGIFFFFFISAVFFHLTKEIQYEGKAVFFEDIQRNQTIGNLKDIVLSENISHSSDAFSFFKTFELNKKLAERLGLQISIVDERSAFNFFFERISKNLKLHFKSKIYDEETLEFTDVFYGGEISSFYFLKFLDQRNFEIFDSNGKFLIRKSPREPVKTKDFCFTLAKIPEKFSGQAVKIKIDPSGRAVIFLLKSIEVKKDKTSPNILILKIRHKDRLCSANILNTLMNMYHNHLADESSACAKDQINYLEKRKSDLEKDLFSLMKENEMLINMNVEAKGFCKLDDEIKNLLNKRENYQRSLEQTNKDLGDLKKIDLTNPDKNILLDENIIKIIDEIKKHEEKKQALLISVDRDIKANKNPCFENGIFYMDSVKNNNDNLESPFDKKDGDLIAGSCEASKNGAFSLMPEKKDSLDAGLSLKDEKFYKKIYMLDPRSAENLYLQLEKSKDDLNLEIAQLRHILNRINLKDFQFSSIAFFVSFDLIKNIIEIQKKINDGQNYSAKEMEVLTQEYETEKKRVIEHLLELLNFKNLNLEIINQKLFSLKKTLINLLAEEISFLTKKIKDLVSKSVYEKTNEKKNLEQNLFDAKMNLRELVNKVFQENKLNMQSERIKSMIDSICKLIESKKLDLNLKKINSRPIDLAFGAIVMAPIFRNALIVAFLSVFIYLLICLYMAILKGMPISAEAVRSLSFDYCGEISKKCAGFDVKDLKSQDLESLRKIISAIDEFKHKIITCICFNGPNYIHYLAALLSIIGKKILVIETKSDTKEKEGLFSFLRDGIKLPIQKIQAYDFVPSGEKDYFSFELLRSFKFIEKLQQIKSKYDLILTYSDAKIDSAEARIYLDFSDKVVLSVKNETLEDIKPFIDWAKEKNKLSFVTY